MSSDERRGTRHRGRQQIRWRQPAAYKRAEPTRACSAFGQGGRGDQELASAGAKRNGGAHGGAHVANLALVPSASSSFQTPFSKVGAYAREVAKDPACRREREREILFVTPLLASRFTEDFELLPSSSTHCKEYAALGITTFCFWN